MQTLLMKPRIFIGSSVEGLEVAHAVQEILEHDDLEANVWQDGVFEPSTVVLSALLEILDNYDFAIFIFTPDDVVHMRRETHWVARDNVLFELGLFAGRLGIQRTFIVQPRGTEQPKLPTDLLGLTPVKYDPERQDGNLLSALAPGCNAIRRKISALGLRAKSSIEEQALNRQHETSKAPVPLSRLVENIKANKAQLENLFVIETGYLTSELRLLMRAAHDAHAISKDGIAIPIVKDDYSLLLHMVFEGPEMDGYFYPSYVLDAEKGLRCRTLSRQDEERSWGFYTVNIVACSEGEGLDSAMTGVRERMLADATHPPDELDFEDIAARLRSALLGTMDLKRPGNHRTNLKPILSLVGEDLAVTMDGIDHVFQPNNLPYFAVEELRGLREPRKDDTIHGDLDFTPEGYLRRSGLSDHPDLSKAMDVVELLITNHASSFGRRR